jgi:hypothetical protein
MVHYQAGSWMRTSSTDQKKWLENNMNLWLPYDGYKLGDAGFKKPENKNAKIFICAHKDFVPVVKSSLYQVVLPKGKDEKDNVVGSFWSELLQMDIITQRKTLPKYIGFCGYRKYFSWLDNAPDIQRLIERHGCAVSLGIDLGMSVKEQYDKIVEGLIFSGIVTNDTTDGSDILPGDSSFGVSARKEEARLKYAQEKQIADMLKNNRKNK